MTCAWVGAVMIQIGLQDGGYEAGDRLWRTTKHVLASNRAASPSGVAARGRATNEGAVGGPCPVVCLIIASSWVWREAAYLAVRGASVRRSFAQRIVWMRSGSVMCR
jgi:hypothetical protein